MSLGSDLPDFTNHTAMLMILSPAKAMDSSDADGFEHSQPQYLKESKVARSAELSAIIIDGYGCFRSWYRPSSSKGKAG